MMKAPILVEEQGLRDGLQTLQQVFSTEKKLEWIQQLLDAGLRRIQVGSFVHPVKVPAMADTDVLFSRLPKRDDVIFSALVLNVKGVERAMAAGAKHLAISLSASSTHSRQNAGMDIGEAKSAVAEMLRLARSAGIAVRGGIQCAFGCRYEGIVAESAVLDLAEFMLGLGVDELVLADSTGMGNPVAVKRVMGAVERMGGGKILGLHLHNTENKGYANLCAGLDAGVRLFDTAFGGLGGCPFIRGATGNIGTEDTVHLLRQMGIDTGIDAAKVAKVSSDLEAATGSTLPGLLYPLLLNADTIMI
jgi:hydroxymethylglutaryl-CoA lyase